MSMYMQFYVRGGDVFYPIGTYNRNSAIYEMFKENGYNDWEKIRAISYERLNAIRGIIKERIKVFEDGIKKYEKTIELIKDMSDCTIGERVEKIHEVEEWIEDNNELIEELQACFQFTIFIEDIIADAESTKYYDNIETIDPNKYVYVGIEIGSPTIEDVVGE